MREKTTRLAAYKLSKSDNGATCARDEETKTDRQKPYCGKLGIRSHHPYRGIKMKVCISGNLRGSSKFHISSKSVKQLPRCVRGDLLYLVALAVGFYSSLYYHNHTSCDKSQTRMWANAQPDGRPAEHRWRPLFNAAKFG